MAFVNIMVHAVWGTKNRTHFLSKEIRPLVIEHIKQNAKIKDIYIDSLNGYSDHLHCLIGLNANMSISQLMQLIKGESAFWINKQKLTNIKFGWADEYYTVSVSRSVVNRVRTYIDGQEEHHKNKTFQQEHDEFIKKYEFVRYG